MENTVENKNLMLQNELNWINNILGRMEDILNKIPTKMENGYGIIDLTDIEQLKWLTKQARHYDNKMKEKSE